MTQYLNVAPSDVLGYKQYYRIVFDVSGQGLLFGSGAAKLNRIYDRMQDSGALAPLSPNPVTEGNDVMVVDAWTIGDGASLSVAEGVRRLESIAGDVFLGAAGGASSVRSIQKLSDIGAVTGGAGDRAGATESANQANDENSIANKLGGFFSGLGDYTTLLVIGLVAYAAITLAPSLTFFSNRKRG